MVMDTLTALAVLGFFSGVAYVVFGILLDD